MATDRFISMVISLAVLVQAEFPAQAEEKTTPGESGYPVPRYVSLARNTVNVRTGPDGKYPIIWVFKKAGLPVKVIAEYKDWRKIVDSEGAKGWIWGPLLSSKRTGLIVAEQQALLKGPDNNQPVAVIAEAGVIGRIRTCQYGWCELDVNGFKGWLKQITFWGTLDRETLD
ncbi:MAG: hypothetical protein COB49_04135 [Alphaproteobacteria bacterium]|nr:MAG: hypothetical protein COB49_04135 [Alphaproteobacteria bacterium]